MVNPIGKTALSAIAVATLGLAGCSMGSAHTAPGPWEAPAITSDGTTTLSGGTLKAPAKIEDMGLDTTAGGELGNEPLADGLPDGGLGIFGLFSPSGMLMRPNGDKVKPQVSIEDLDTGEVHKYDASVYAGAADQEDGSGSFGEFVLLPDSTLVWMARQQTQELALDKYDVYSMKPGAKPVHIGSSTPDVSGGLALTAPGDGNYLTVVGDNAWWVEGDLIGQAPGAKQYSNIYTAPLDGSRSQHVAIDAARLVQADTCADDPTLIYVEDATSSAGRIDLATLSAAKVDANGDLGSGAPLWSAWDSNISVDTADACGEHFAVAYVDWSNGEDAETHPTGVLIGGPEGTVYYAMPDQSTGAGRVTVTSFGVFFFDWGGLTYGKQYFYSYATGDLYFIGNGASFGFTKVGDKCAAMAWVDPEDASVVMTNYRVRKVCAT